MADTIKHVAIVGMGIAGVSALREWTKQKENNPAIEITVFGDAKTFGRGVPYQKDDHLLIMNQPADLATIIPENPDDFVEWLEDTQGEEDASHGYYPRALFGSYLHERMESWLMQANAKVIKEKVVKIEPLKNRQFRVATNSCQQTYDVVHLSIGSAPYTDYYGLSEHPNFILDPFPVEENLADIPKGATVGVLGTGLTSVDILRYLNQRRSDIELSFYSHSGRFKTARGETIPFNYQYFTAENIKAEKEKNNGFIPLEIYVEWFKKELAYQDVSLHTDWIKQPFGSKENIKRDLTSPHEIGVVQTLILGMDRFLTEIWMALTEVDKATFFERYGEQWDKVRSSFPVESGEILHSLWDEDKIKVFGNVVDIIEQDQSFKILFKNQETQIVDYLINATGSQKNVNYKLERNPLLRQLLNNRILQPEPFGGVQVTVPTLSAVSQKYGVLDRFKVHGPLISGIQFGNNSIDIISEGVQTAVLDLVKLNK